MSAEHNRLVEAWIAGRLAEGEEQTLLRLAETDAEFAQLLREQQGLNAGIGADLAGLNARYDHQAFRSRVAELSMRTPATPQTVGKGEVSRSRGAGRWIAGLFLIAGTSADSGERGVVRNAAGIYLATDTAPETGSGNVPSASVETVLPAETPSALPAPEIPAEETAPAPNTAAASDNDAPRAVDAGASVAVGKAQPKNTPSETAARSDLPAAVTAAPAGSPARTDQSIEVQGSVEVGKLP